MMNSPPPSASDTRPQNKAQQRLRDNDPLFTELESVMRQYWNQNQDKVAAGTFVWPPPKTFYKNFESRFKAWCSSDNNKIWTSKARNAISRMKEKNPGWKISRKKGKIIV